MIELVNVTKYYQTDIGRHYVLRDVSLVIPRNINVAIVGSNGAGKSTMLRLLAGVDTPNSGKIIRNGRISWPMGLTPGVQKSLNGVENARFACRIYGLPHDQIRTTIDRVRELAGIGKYFDLPVETYSSGMRSRLSFAISMSLDFDYYLFDEIGAGGDKSFKKQANELIEKRLNSANFIMVSHTPQDIVEYCQAAILLRQGTVTWFDDARQALEEYGERDFLEKFDKKSKSIHRKRQKVAAESAEAIVGSEGTTDPEGRIMVGETGDSDREQREARRAAKREQKRQKKAAASATADTPQSPTEAADAGQSAGPAMSDEQRNAKRATKREEKHQQRGAVSDAQREARRAAKREQKLQNKAALSDAADTPQLSAADGDADLSSKPTLSQEQKEAKRAAKRQEKLQNKAAPSAAADTPQLSAADGDTDLSPRPPLSQEQKEAKRATKREEKRLQRTAIAAAADRHRLSKPVPIEARKEPPRELRRDVTEPPKLTAREARAPGRHEKLPTPDAQQMASRPAADRSNRASMIFSLREEQRTSPQPQESSKTAMTAEALRQPAATPATGVSATSPPSSAAGILSLRDPSPQSGSGASAIDQLAERWAARRAQLAGGANAQPKTTGGHSAVLAQPPPPRKPQE